MCDEFFEAVGRLVLLQAFYYEVLGTLLDLETDIVGSFNIDNRLCS